jgi:hypothetical protein
MPILIPAKRLDPKRPDCIEAALADEVARLSTVSENRDLLTNALDTSALVLVDGVDELRDEALILGAFECIAEFTRNILKDYFIQPKDRCFKTESYQLYYAGIGNHSKQVNLCSNGSVDNPVTISFLVSGPLVAWFAQYALTTAIVAIVFK